MKNFSRYLKEVKAEMAKVVWPSFTELIGATIIVLILVTILAVYLFGVDYVLKLFAQKIYITYSGLR